MKLWPRLAMSVIAAALVLSLGGCRTPRDKPVLEDDFETADGTWDEHIGVESTRGYTDGAFFIEIGEPNWFSWAESPKRYGDVRIEIGIQLASGPSEAHAGVICRLADEGAFYYMAVTSDGYYGIFRRVDWGALEAINSAGAMVFSSAIKTGNEPNRLSVRCEGDALSLSVNDVLLETVTDGTLRRGRIGFGAGSGPGGSVRLIFDDLSLYAY